MVLVVARGNRRSFAGARPERNRRIPTLTRDEAARQDGGPGKLFCGLNVLRVVALRGASGSFDFAQDDSDDFMAEEEGFEPPLPVKAKRFSRPSVSTTHTFLRSFCGPLPSG